MANRYATQGSLLAHCLKQRAHTYMQMLSHRVSTSPHKRVMEWLSHNPDWALKKAKNRQNLVTWRIVKAG